MKPLLKNIISLIIIVSTIVYFNLRSKRYNEQTNTQFKNMEPPVIVIEKNKYTFWYGVILKDNKGNIYDFKNSSILANSIGEMYEVNDTVKR